MTSLREQGEDMGRAIAQRSPRLGGVLLLLLGGAFIGLGFCLDKAALLILSALPLSGGAWIVVTGRTWKVPDDKPPMWWKAGFMIAIGAGVAMSYAYVFSGRAGGF
jgi:hypothetical protein